MVPTEQMPLNVTVGSGQEYAVQAGITPSTDALRGLLVYSSANLKIMFVFSNITKQQLYENCWTGLGMNFYPLSSSFSLPAFSKNIHRGVEVNYLPNHSHR